MFKVGDKVVPLGLDYVKSEYRATQDVLLHLLKEKKTNYFRVSHVFDNGNVLIDRNGSAWYPCRFKKYTGWEIGYVNQRVKG